MDTMTLWKYSLTAGGAVVLVVAVLLLTILAAARSIDRHANDIWEVGKRIAANTVSIWMLQQTNAIAGQILETARGIAAGAGSIEAKVDGLGRALTGK